MTIPNCKDHHDVLPRFLIAGTAKSGTTALYQYLKAHPEVYMSPIKEPNFFATDIDPSEFRPDYRNSFVTDIDSYIEGGMQHELHIAFIRKYRQYLALFEPGKSYKTRGEMSNSYMFSTSAAAEIHKCIPDCRIVIMLRNPVDRAFSHYKMDLSNGLVKDNFDDAVRKDHNRRRKGWGISSLYVELGMYASQLKRFYDHFPREQVLVMLYENFQADNNTSLKEIYRFVGVDECFDIGEKTEANISAIPRNAGLVFWLKQSGLKGLAERFLPDSVKKLGKGIIYGNEKKVIFESETRDFLYKLFTDDIDRLEKLTGLSLSSWKAGALNK